MIVKKRQIDLRAELESIKEPVWKKIREYLPDKDPREHYGIIRDYPERQGKYFRPGLLLFSAQMHGASFSEAILPAAAMQVSEDWLLIHDDFEDHSLERRSTKDEFRPTLNVKYGDELAVNAGDALHIIMWRILGDCAKILPSEIGWKIYDKMNDVLLTTTEGQFMELEWIRKGKVRISRNEYFKMIYIKAGYYTVTGPLQLGAIIARRGGQYLKKIEQWGVPFGCAFQIWDDILNVSQESGIQGKEKGGDILEGKQTLILKHLLEHCTEKEKRFIVEVYRKRRADKTQEEKDLILRLMEKYGSIDYTKKIARKFAVKAGKIFERNTAALGQSRAKAVIREAIDFVVNRER